MSAGYDNGVYLTDKSLPAFSWEKDKKFSWKYVEHLTCDNLSPTLLE